MMEIFLTISFGGRSGQNWEMWPLGLSVGLSQVTSFLQTVWWFCIPAATAAVTASLSFCSVPTSGEGLLHQLLTRSAAVGSTQTVMATCSNWGALQPDQSTGLGLVAGSRHCVWAGTECCKIQALALQAETSFQSSAEPGRGAQSREYTEIISSYLGPLSSPCPKS